MLGAVFGAGRHKDTPTHRSQLPAKSVTLAELFGMGAVMKLGLPSPEEPCSMCSCQASSALYFCFFKQKHKNRTQSSVFRALLRSPLKGLQMKQNIKTLPTPRLSHTLRGPSKGGLLCSRPGSRGGRRATMVPGRFGLRSFGIQGSQGIVETAGRARTSNV